MPATRGGVARQMHLGTSRVFRGCQGSLAWQSAVYRKGASRYILNPETEARELRSKGTLTLQPNDVISYRTPGSGYGPASDRDPEAVLRDVIQEKVTSERAGDAYQVVVDPQERQIDVEATERLRGDTRNTS